MTRTHAHAGAHTKAKRQKAIYSIWPRPTCSVSSCRRRRAESDVTRFHERREGRRRCFLSALRLAICRAVERNFICANMLHVNVITKPICCLLSGECSHRPRTLWFSWSCCIRASTQKTRPFEIRLFCLEMNFCVSNFFRGGCWHERYGWITADFSEIFRQ